MAPEERASLKRSEANRATQEAAEREQLWAQVQGAAGAGAPTTSTSFVDVTLSSVAAGGHAHAHHLGNFSEKHNIPSAYA